MGKTLQKITGLPKLLLAKSRTWRNFSRLEKISTQAGQIAKRNGPKILFGSSFCINHTLKIHDVLLTSLLAAKGAQISYYPTLMACRHAMSVAA